MGLMERIFGDTDSDREPSEYIELSVDDHDLVPSVASRQIRIAKIANNNTDIIQIKDAVYDGDIVIADITRHSTQDRTMEHIIDELKQVANEVDGDIAQKDDDELIITPTGVSISRERLGSR